MQAYVGEKQREDGSSRVEAASERYAATSDVPRTFAILDEPRTINGTHLAFLCLSPVAAALSLAFYVYHEGFAWLDAGAFVLMYVLTGLAVTGGYHRYYAHRTYKCHKAVQLFYALFGAAALQAPVLDWVAEHRDHHRFVDQSRDPYSIKKGFFWAHIGWIIHQAPAHRADLASVPDLVDDPLLIFQKRHYRTLGLLIGFGLPCLLGAFWGRPVGAVVWGAYCGWRSAINARFSSTRPPTRSALSPIRARTRPGTTGSFRSSRWGKGITTSTTPTRGISGPEFLVSVGSNEMVDPRPQDRGPRVGSQTNPALADPGPSQRARSPGSGRAMTRASDSLDVSRAEEPSTQSTLMSIFDLLLEGYPKGDFLIRVGDRVLRKPSDGAARYALVFGTPETVRRMFISPSERSFGEAYIDADFDIEGDLNAVFPLVDYLRGRSLSVLQNLRMLRLLRSLPRLRRVAVGPAPSSTARRTTLEGTRPKSGDVPLRPAGGILRAVARPADGLLLRLFRVRRVEFGGGSGAEARPHLSKAAP